LSPLKFTQLILHYLPSELGNLPNLTYLSLNGNNLTGEIPNSLGNLANIYYVVIEHNALYTHDSTLLTFLNNKGPGWTNSQTIAPEDVTVSEVGTSSVLLQWTPIAYTEDTGGYRIYYGTVPGGPSPGKPYGLFGTTDNKSASQMEITGLEAETIYYFVIQAWTDPNRGNKNTVYSDYSRETSVNPFPWELFYPVFIGKN